MAVANQEDVTVSDVAAPALRGLSAAEVQARRAAGQGNSLASESSRPYREIIRENVFTFINNTLFALGLALVLLGRYSDAIVSVGVILVNVVVSVVQEVRAKRTLDRIALLTRPKASVIRDGVEQSVDPAELVLGDTLVVRPGDQIVLDGVVVGDGRMDVDESLLTGESDLIPKAAGDPVYSGSFCVTGGACYQATRVGADSLANQLTAGARAYRRMLTPLQQEVNLVIRVILLVVIFFEFLVVLASLAREIPLVESVQMSVVIAGLVPNGLFLAIAVAYAVGAVRMVGQGALIQQANAVESLSNVSVLCLDKTGTLTANRILLHAVRPVGLSEAALRAALGDYAASTSAGNRTSEAIAAACPGVARRVREEVPFSSARKWSAIAFDDPARRGVYVLGAPEMLAPAVPLGEELAAQQAAWAEQGLRVLLFAHRPDLTPLHDAGGAPRLPDGLTPVGLLSFSDELRPEARATLAGFREAGIALKIISGDNPATVAALARQAGLGPEITLVSGPELAQMDEAQFAETAARATIFGRITPQQKEQLVQALRRRGHHVAMIGDGVNDVLSLKRSNIGIAMQSGSQATRGVADIVLLNDSFAALPNAFLEGQRIINGMQDILKLFLARIVYVALLIIATGLVAGFPFTPKQSSLLALLTVGIPTIALAAWARPGPRPRGSLTRSLIHFVLPAAFTIGIAGAGVYLAFLLASYRALGAAGPGAAPEAVALVALAHAQTALMSFCVLCGLLLIVFAEPPTAFWTGGDVVSGDWRPTLLAALLLALFGAIAFVPALRDFFELAPLPPVGLLAIALVAVAWAAVLRFIWRRRLLDRFLGVELAA
jgi:cation-transporting ATPase E